MPTSSGCFCSPAAHIVWYPSIMNRPVRAVSLLVLVALSVSSLCGGCGPKKRVAAAVTREVVAESHSDSTGEDDTPQMVSETSEMSTEQMGSFCSGPLGCAVQGIGWVLALPFRAVVGLVDVMF